MIVDGARLALEGVIAAAPSHERELLDRSGWRSSGACESQQARRQLLRGDCVAGRLRWREWEKDGEKRQAVDITADSVIPIPRPATAQRADVEAGAEEVAAA